MPLLSRNAVRLSNSISAEPRGGGGKGYWPNFDNRGDFMSFDTHIRTRPKSLLHLYSSIWDAHQVLNPPFFPHVKNKSKRFSPGTMPLFPHRHHAPHTKFQTHTPSISSSSLVQSKTTIPACHWQKGHTRSFFLFYFFFGQGKSPYPPKPFPLVSAYRRLVVRTQ